MRGTFDFDPAEREYGAATAAIRQILAEWAAIDWFVPPREPAAEARAARLLREHNARARAHLPEVFPATVETRSSGGGWREFTALRDRVCKQPWNWKFSALKPLSSHHSKARGWTLSDQAKHCVDLQNGGAPRPGDLFVRVGDVVLWNGLDPDLYDEARLPRDGVEPARWYLGYACIDALECIEWQLAEGNDDLEGNPFLPLLRCYAAGFYPFSLDQTTLILFAFDR
ncbi:hypothetical protein [Sorangium cellulosum]|uniref:Uncharacterized protein n=1 Tax=Sorangium cellulosum TaxID=56 RepID=A0A150QHE8_SORCE|nr:hypothetical protein [Sorangium cellulosum]KYF67399.1 hypothetical protein BE15_41345 [Sorangium cellulosum]